MAALFALASCQPKETKLYVASINDMHANIDNFPKLAYVLDSLRTLYPDMLLFSAGDNRSGNRKEATPTGMASGSGRYPASRQKATSSV